MISYHTLDTACSILNQFPLVMLKLNKFYLVTILGLESTQRVCGTRCPKLFKKVLRRMSKIDGE